MQMPTTLIGTFGKKGRAFLQHAPNPYWLSKLRFLPLFSRSLSLEIYAPGIGFFAHLNWRLHTAGFCQHRQLSPLLSATSPQYRDPTRSSNWLSYYFDAAPQTAEPDFRISDLNQLRIGSRSGLSSIEVAAELRRKYLPVKTEITKKVEIFVARRMLGRTTLGVHFRGTDKKGEAERVSWERVQQTIENYLRRNPAIDCLFVASDEAPFINFIEQAFPNLLVISHDDRFRSATNRPFHMDDHGEDNYGKGEEALMNCLLLSRCSALIRTTSFLSAWASIFNPDLPIILLNRPYDSFLWFPERLLIPRSMDEYLPSADIEASDEKKQTYSAGA